MKNMNQQFSILVVDDEKRIVDEITEFLKSKGFLVKGMYKPRKIIDFIKQNSVDIVILDIRLPGISGLELLQQIKTLKPEIEVIMISGHGDMNTVIEAMRKGATDYFPKPFRLMDVYKAIIRTERFVKLNKELKSTKISVDILSKKLLENIGVQLIGDSKSMQHLINLMNRVAQSPNTSVLILGESGTGKELVAHGIHYLSKRHNQKFYSVNCSAIPETLFESEFFGHKKGAFTGADNDKEGWFEIADKGTLFLDEISDLPLVQQAKLLRVLEERKVSKLGSRESKTVDVRVVAASNRDLEKLVQENKFRADLFHRLGIFIIKIPSLRERKEDIEALTNYYINRNAEQMGKNVKGIKPEALQKLMSYDFPGNVRELRNIIERAMIFCDDSELNINHIQLSGFNSDDSTNIETKSVELLPSDSIQNFDLEENEKILIKKALNAANNKKSKAAELLNITWQALDRRMKKYGME